MKYSYRIGVFLGAPIYVHLSTGLIFLYFMATRNDGEGAIMAVCFLALMLVHEMGHAWFVRKYGHDLVEIKLYPIHGHCLYSFDSRFEPETLIYAGGLLAQILVLLGYLSFLWLLDFMALFSTLRKVEPLTYVFVELNIVVLIFNSLPIPGLDGFYLWKRLYEFFGNKARKSTRVKRNSKEKRTVEQESPEKIVQVAIEKAKRNE